MGTSFYFILFSQVTFQSKSFRNIVVVFQNLDVQYSLSNFFSFANLAPIFLLITDNGVLDSYLDLEKAKEALLGVQVGSRFLAEVDETMTLKDPHRVGGQNQGLEMAAGFNKYWKDGYDIKRLLVIGNKYLHDIGTFQTNHSYLLL